MSETENLAMANVKMLGDAVEKMMRARERAAAERMREACIKLVDAPAHRTNREWDIKVTIERAIHALDIDRVLEDRP